MPAGKPYSFRYLYDAVTAFDSLREKLSNAVTGSREYDQLVQKMSDRDRSLEDHLNLNVGQGMIGQASATAIQSNIPGVETPLTGLAVTVTVPANRLLKIMAQVTFDMTGTAAGDTCKARLRLRDELNNLVGTGQTYGLYYTDLLRDTDTAFLIVFLRPSAGTHTYTLNAIKTNDTAGARVEALMAASQPGVLIVEDCGPVTQ